MRRPCERVRTTWSIEEHGHRLGASVGDGPNTATLREARNPKVCRMQHGPTSLGLVRRAESSASVCLWCVCLCKRTTHTAFPSGACVIIGVMKPLGFALGVRWALGRVEKEDEQTLLAATGLCLGGVKELMVYVTNSGWSRDWCRREGVALACGRMLCEPPFPCGRGFSPARWKPGEIPFRNRRGVGPVRKKAREPPFRSASAFGSARRLGMTHAPKKSALAVAAAFSILGPSPGTLSRAGQEKQVLKDSALPSRRGRRAP